MRVAAAAILLLAATPVLAQPGGARRLANPSALVSATLALNEAARRQGRPVALRRAAAKDAILFPGRVVNADAHLRHDLGSEPVRWSPARVVMACDGTAGLVVGTRHSGDQAAGFAMLWRTDDKGRYRWIAYAEDAAPPVSTEDIDGRIADCPRRPAPPPSATRPGPGRKATRPAASVIADPPPAVGAGQSADRSLGWSWDMGARRFTVKAARGTAAEPVLDMTLAPAGR